MNKILMSPISAFFLAIAIIPGNVGWATPTAFAAESETEQTKESGLSADDEEKTKHEDVKKEKEHDREGMHGMMMGHSKGWMIVIGAVMVVMMAAHVIVLF